MSAGSLQALSAIFDGQQATPGLVVSIVVTFITGCIGLHRVYWVDRSSQLKVSERRTRRLFRLVERGAWRTAPPLILQQAVLDARGEVLDDRLIRFALARHQPMALFGDLRRAAGLVWLAADGQGLVPEGHPEPPGMRFRRNSWISFGIGYVPFSLCLVAMPFVSRKYAGLAIVVLVVTTLFGFCMLWVAGKYESAHRLTTLADNLYPLWDAPAEPTAKPKALRLGRPSATALESPQARGRGGRKRRAENAGATG
ncbi:hypothetical protein P3W24_12290 [Luteibacter sp. PPL201]|uniref:Uncharacterized protein n=1 Tax=Luteibacter sahnii TaxID=3021977 RepID=A0ABT6BCD1_9GAMM